MTPGARAAIEATLLHPDVRRLGDSIRARPGIPTSPYGIGAWAAVAVILRAAGSGTELLFIRRVERQGDAWSGQVALPGGREDADDGGLERTAIRETWEEIGLDLAAHGEMVGALDDVAPRTPVLPPVAVRPFVFAVAADVHTVAGAEVADTFWVPLEHLLDASRRTTTEVAAATGPLTVDAILYGDHVIWGMTLRIVDGLAERLA